MFPRRKDLFTAWSKAMVEGATVDKPNYSPAGARRANKGRAQPQNKLKRRRRRKSRKKRKDG